MAKKIDYDKWSKEELIKEIRRIRETTYGLVWHRDLPEEKIDVLINPDARTPSEMFPNEMAGKPFPVLKEVKLKTIETNRVKPVNVLIEGDNYHSLAVLNFTHEASIDLIYIDPPYNTGNDDFIYTDKIKSEYVRRDDPFRHSKWLAFMERRLKLARNLLTRDGVIFISIDDNELAQLKLLCDEIFGEQNFIELFSWMKTETPSNLSNKTKKKLEYILCYERERSPLRYTGLRRESKSSNSLLNQTNAIKELRFPAGVVETGIKDSILKKGKYGTDRYSVELLNDVRVKDGLFAEDFALRAKFRWSQEKLNQEIAVKTKIIIPTTKLSPAYEREEYAPETPSNFINGDEGVGTNEDAGNDLADMFNGKKVFDYPKPVTLIKYLIGMINKKDSIILDFMAGSGTTGHAVLEMNKEDGGNRRFILCTNNENDICTEVCYPRMSKVIKGYKNAKGERVEGFGGNLRYYTTAFVEAEPSDKNKRKLVNESTEMLCIREEAFEPVADGADWKIFKNAERYLGIVFDEDAIGDFKKAIRKIDGCINAYVFSLGDEPHEKDFEDFKNRVTLCAIPEVILRVYREIFK